MDQNNLFILLFIVLSLQILCCGQVLQFGACNDVVTKEYFALEQFLGKWYEIERFPIWYEEFGQCAFKDIRQCGRRIEIQHGYVKNSIQYILHVNSSYAPGDEAVFNISENNIDPIGIPLSITATDYTTYAIVYGCKANPMLNLKYITAWILSRNTTLSPDLLKIAHQELNSLPSASTAYLEPVDHSEESCSFYWSAHVQANYINNTYTET